MCLDVLTAAGGRVARLAAKGTRASRWQLAEHLCVSITVLAKCNLESLRKCDRLFPGPSVRAPSRICEFRKPYERKDARFIKCTLRTLAVLYSGGHRSA